MVHLINYRLRKPGKDYDALYAAIMSVCPTYWHNTTSSWLVETNLSEQQIYNHIAKHIDANDELVVFRINAWWGKLDPANQKWLQDRTL